MVVGSDFRYRVHSAGSTAGRAPGTELASTDALATCVAFVRGLLFSHNLFPTCILNIRMVSLNLDVLLFRNFRRLRNGNRSDLGGPQTCA